MKKIFILLALVVPSTIVIAQDEDDWGDMEEEEGAIDIFNDTRIINSHSVETLDKGTLDFRITHRFGDIATTASPRTLFGLDNSTDIRIAFEYGITEDLTVGFGRSKGAGPLSQFWDGLAKYSILKQGEHPLSLTVCGSAFYTSMKADEGVVSATSFTKTAHRFSYYTQIIAAMEFADRFAIQVAPGYLHRNYVPFEDENGLLCVGAVARARIWPNVSLFAEYTHVLRTNNTILNVEYENPLGFGIEFKTFAHAFMLGFMNSPGIGEGQFIPYTASSWGDGEYRFGFTISRHF